MLLMTNNCSPSRFPILANANICSHKFARRTRSSSRFSSRFVDPVVCVWAGVRLRFARRFPAAVDVLADFFYFYFYDQICRGDTSFITRTWQRRCRFALIDSRRHHLTRTTRTCLIGSIDWKIVCAPPEVLEARAPLASDRA